MKLIRFILLFLILSQSAFSQDNCPEFDRLMKEAENFFKKSEYRKALYKYNSAKTCSPSNRKEVDEKINQLFEKIEAERLKAVANEKEIQLKHQQLLAAKENEKRMQEIQKALELKDSINFAESFIRKNKNLVDTVLSAAEKKQLLHHIESLRLAGHGNQGSSLASSLMLLHKAGGYSNNFFDLYNQGLKIKEGPDFFRNRSTPISHIGYIAYDSYYYWALEKISQSENLLPESSKLIYRSKIQNISDSLKIRRERLEKNYWMADTVIDIYEKDNLFNLPCSDNQNFVWGYFTSSFEDYKKKNLRFLNLPVKDFSFTTDSLVQLAPAGKFYKVLAADADYRYMVVKEVEYSLKKSLIEFENKTDVTPAVIKLIDKNGMVLNDLSSFLTNAYFFSPDANFVATWKASTDNSFELILYNLKTQSFWKIPNAHSSNTMSFSSDSKTMLYYNDSTRQFYFLDLTGKKPEVSSSFSPAIPGIENIDFTGLNSFLKINTPGKTILYDIAQRKIVFQFDNNFIKNIIVAPNKSDILITCNREYDERKGFLTYRVDMDLNIKDRLYSDCENYFYTPDGKFIVAYDQWNIMRWSTDENPEVKNEFRACIGLTELLEKSGVPFDYFQRVNDAVQIEKGARKFYTLGTDGKNDSVLANLYLRQSQLLFDRLKIGDAQNLLRERAPFFYDWANYIRTLLGDRDVYQRFTSQQAAVGIFDNLLNSADSIYPQLLYYAANSNMLLGNMYDSLHYRNVVYLDLLKKEISLREKVFSKDPDNDDNIYYLKRGFQKLSAISDSVGWQNLLNKKYYDRLSLLRSVEEYLDRGLKSLPESFDLEILYINALAQLAPSYLYIYANKPDGNEKALDSAIYYADKGISLFPGTYDLASFLVIKARAYLLQNDGLSKALELYDKVKRDYPEFRKETMLQQLQLLREAGADEQKISKAEEFIKKD